MHAIVETLGSANHGYACLQHPFQLRQPIIASVGDTTSAKAFDNQTLISIGKIEFQNIRSSAGNELYYCYLGLQGCINEEFAFSIAAALQGGGYGEGEFSINTQLETKIAVVKIIPGATPDILDYYVKKGYKGLIIEGFGAGGVPNGDNNWLPKLEQVLKQGLQVVCTTQCLYDGVHLDTYPMGILAERLGARSAGLDTIETALIKLMQELAQ